MTEPRIHQRAARNRKKGTIPLSKLRTSDAVRTVLDNPRRLEELLCLLEDKDRCVRDRAAATLARLSDSHPGRLQRALPRLRECLGDESAYVRWHLVYAFGQLSSRCSACSREILGDLVARLDDANRIVRVIACKALSTLAARHPAMVAEFFDVHKREIPPAVARFLNAANPPPCSQRTRT